MNAINELKAMLDERGVKYRDNVYSCNTQWMSLNRGAAYASQCKHDESLLELTVYTVTPQQAIDATLGRGECQECHATEQNYNHCKYSTNRGWCDDECELQETCDDYVHIRWCRCSVCGAEVLAYPANFCPNCKRQVKR